MRREIALLHSNPDLGFTLLEVMVALVVGTLIVGGVMGLISASLRFTQRVNEKSQVLPVLEAAAQEILATPEEITQGAFTMKDFPDGTVVDVQLTKALAGDSPGLGSSHGQLYRVRLSCRGSLMEFSVIVPQKQK